MASSMKASVGKWRAAPMPQYKKGDQIDSNWGGSNFSAFTTSPHLKEATLFATFMGGDAEAGKFWNTKEFLFPVQKSLIDDKELMGTKYDFSASNSPRSRITSIPRSRTSWRPRSAARARWPTLSIGSRQRSSPTRPTRATPSSE